MSAQPSYQNSKAEEHARWRRRDHANLEAMQNLVIARIAEETGVEMPPNVRQLISALQGAHGGGAVAYEQFGRDYLTVGAQLQFKGSEDAIRSRVRHWINDLLSWQRAAGVELFSVVKGGEVVGTRPGGAPIRKKTIFVDQLKPKADEAVQRARQSETWRGDEKKDIKPHPGRALAEQVEWLMKELPALDAGPEAAGREKKQAAPLPVAEYERRQEARLSKALEDTADEIERRDGDADLWLEGFERLIRKMRGSRRRTAPARRNRVMLDEVGDVEDEAPDTSLRSGSTAYMCNTAEAPEAPACGTRLRNTDDTQAAPENLHYEGIGEPEDAESAPSALEWALAYASQGVAVFPLQPKAKAPLGKLAPHGVKDATTEPDTIRRWFRKEPSANLGVAMGGSLHLLAVDVDPRAGGDASLCDLVEAHGLEWLETFTVRTGGNGLHFLFRLPEGVKVHKGKLAPGVDLKAEGGYLVAPPSVHPCGRRYEVERNAYIAEAPAWLVEELTREQPAKVIDFQEKRGRRRGGGPVIAEGERNRRLFEIGCALWGRGEATDVVSLHARLLQVRDERCASGSDPVTDREVAKIAASIGTRYPPGVSIRGDTA